MAFEKIAEAKIRQAMEDGVFDDLPNRGQRIDLEGYFKLPAELRMCYSVLKSAGCVPEEVELLATIDRLEADVAAAADPASRGASLKALEDARLRLRLLLEQNRHRK